MYLHFAGVSILLIPFSFDFVDALCVATVLGFVCTVSNKIVLRGLFNKSSKVAVISLGQDVALESSQDNNTRRVSSVSPSRTKGLSTIDDGSSIVRTSSTKKGSEHVSPGSPLPRRVAGLNGLSKHMPRHKSLPSLPVSYTATSRFENEESGTLDEAERGKGQLFCHLPGRLPTQTARQQLPHSKYLGQSSLDAEVSHGDRSSLSSKFNSTSTTASSCRSILGKLRRVKVGARSRRVWTEPVKKGGNEALQTIESANGPTVHWKLALVATVELVLKVVNDQSHK